MNYLKQIQYIAKVNENDEVLGMIEKWEAHKEGTLHRAFTVAITFEDQILLQYRKHPVFDNIFDATISSHPIYNNEVLQDTEEAVFQTLEREWHITKKDLSEMPIHKGFVKYKAKDSRSDYIEHEICHIYECKAKVLKLPNMEFAYGFCLKKREDMKNSFDPIYPLLAPWVHAAIEQQLL